MTRDRARWMLSVAMLIVIFATTPAGAGDVPVAGAKLTVIDDAARPARRKIVLLVRDENASVLPAPDGPDDPRCPTGGTAFELQSATHAETTGALVMPCEHWSATGSRVTGYKYKDRNGAVRAAAIKQRGGILKVVVKGSLGDFTLDEPSQGALTAVLSFGGGMRLCATFGGEVRKDEPGVFGARRAEAPLACPPLPATPTPTSTATPVGTDLPTPHPSPTMTSLATPMRTVTATAMPTVTGSASATFTATPTATPSATLGASPTATATPGAPSEIDFGDVDRDLNMDFCRSYTGYCGAAHVTRLVRLRNSGPDPVTIGAISSDAATFGVAEHSTVGPISPGGEFFITVTFDPRQVHEYMLCSSPRPPAPAQNYTATLTIATSAGTIAVPMHGRTVDAVTVGSLQPMPIPHYVGQFCLNSHPETRLEGSEVNAILDFGTVAGGSSSTKPIRNLVNVGGAPARVVSAEIVGPDAGLFRPPVLQPAAGFEFPASTPRLPQYSGGVDPAGAAVDVTFAPDDLDDTRTVAAVLVLHTDADQAIEIGLTGQAYEGPLLALTVPPAYEFERTNAGPSARTTNVGSNAAGLTPATLTVRNDGNHATGAISIRLTPIAGSLPGGFAHDLPTGPIAPFTTRTVTLSFSPAAAGHYSAYLEVLEDGVVRASALLHGIGKASGVSVLGTSEPWYVVDDALFDDTRVVGVVANGTTNTLTPLTGIDDPCLVHDPESNIVDIDQYIDEQSDLAIVGGTVYAVDTDVFDGRDEDQLTPACRRRLEAGNLGTAGVLKGGTFLDGPGGVNDLFAAGSTALDFDVAPDGTVFFTEVPPGGPTRLAYRKQGSTRVLIDDVAQMVGGPAGSEVGELRVIRRSGGYRLFVALDDPAQSSAAIDVAGTTTLSVASVGPLALPLDIDARLGAGGLVYTAALEGTEIVVTATDLTSGTVAAQYRSGTLPFVPFISDVYVDRLGNVVVDTGAQYWFAPDGTPRGFVTASRVFYADDHRGGPGGMTFCDGRQFGDAVVCLEQVWFER